ncbi:MAG: activator of (R)-2-hydroxyglutaryl-CoA dehydratase [Terriglobia bacterium]
MSTNFENSKPEFPILPVISSSPGTSTGAPIQISTALAAEQLIKDKLLEERLRLIRELGYEEKKVKPFKRPTEKPFTASQRNRTTILFGGLTWKHEKIIHGALEGLGYKCEAIPTPNVRAFQLGKEYGNNGQCNPTYFTVGNLVQYLQRLEESGMSRQDIIDNHVFFTAGACGPCRFGMYEAEYRLALRNSGFDGFRVLLFQQSGGLNQAEAEAGLEMNLDFFLGILNAMNIGDLINDCAYQIRPFEVNKGETDEVLDECVDYLHDVIKKHEPYKVEGKFAELINRFPSAAGTAEYVGKFLTQLYGDEYTGALRHVRNRLNSIEVDRTRIKPIVKITGEFWAQTTEGEGNFNMFKFLEREGAQVLVEPIGTWIMYMIHQAKQGIRDRKGVDEKQEAAKAWEVTKKLAQNWHYRSVLGKLTVAEKIFKREWNRLRDALDHLPHDLTDQYELQRLGHPFYNSRAGGGEGHLEVAKNIYYSNKGICHMVLSLKPFGCMPSTQSDGAQSAVVNQYKDMIYLPIETSGEGEINAHSRVQMALGEAKVKAKAEFAEVLRQTGYTLDEIKAYVDEHSELKRPMFAVPHYKGIIGVGAAFVKHVGEQMKAESRSAVSEINHQVQASA